MLWKTYAFLGLLFSSLSPVSAQPGDLCSNIKIDQFGYFPSARKVAVITRARAGFNVATEGSYNASVAEGAFQVRRWGDNALVYSGAAISWHRGAIHDQSGDMGWWFDFTGLSAAGTYYIYDAGNNVRSHPFAIGSTVYNDVLIQALRVFFYQRINFAKQPPFADSRWADGAAFGGTDQDYAARSLAGTDPKDLSGGWMDAGDYNKYSTFAASAVLPLLEAYRRNPAVFGDASGIPESGNGVADLLDEVKWEVDWYKRMQDATGSSKGLFLKVGVTSWNSASPASADSNPRYYLGECTSATICGAAVFALSSTVYRSLGAGWASYADDLLQRAKDAWSRASTVTSGFTGNFETACDDQTIKAGDADVPVASQKNMAFAAAVYLYEATGDAAYKTYVDAHYTDTYPFVAGYWGPYYPVVQKALLRYASLPTSGPGPFATASVAEAIRSNKAAQNGSLSINDYDNGTDLYRSFMPTTDYTWGSNRTKCYAALNNYDSYWMGINPASAAGYKEAAEAYLHYLHGVNALGMVMLTNMYNYGGDKCANQMSHAWFSDGSDWDDALNSPYGPPPGYLTGGCNEDYPVSYITPPYGQPPLKAYRDWNTDWNSTTNSDEASYSITEPSISNQAAYVAALSDAIASYNNLSVLPVDFLAFTVAPGPLGAGLNWQVSETDNLLHFVVERSEDGRRFAPIATVPGVSGQLHYAYTDAAVTGNTQTVCYRIRSVETGREAFSVLRWLRGAAMGGLKLSPNPVHSYVLLEGVSGAAATLELELRNSAGLLLRRESLVVPAGLWRRRIMLEGLPAGVYLGKVQAAGSSETFTLVKE